MNAAEKLAKGIVANHNKQLQSNTIDLPAHVESLLQSLGATTSDSGGKVPRPTSSSRIAVRGGGSDSISRRRKRLNSARV